ncbi:MAG: dehydrogenase [Actinobacteria bacterium]|nr:MAG: dehydrogenase [Actinomycetota bacterium]
MEATSNRYDVAILGGGLAGLTLALQLKRQRPETSIFVAEKRPGPAPEAAFKVGESTVEISADYFARVCDMKDHIEQDELFKAGLRFFFPAGDNSDITQRVEWGDSAFAPVPTYQLDRGRFENELARRNVEAGIDLVQGAFVDEVELDGDQHSVTIVQGGPGGDRSTITARWVVDAAGRSFILRNKLGLAKDVEHDINSAWWRVGNGLVDHEEWGAHDETWMARMERPGIRRYSTTHLAGEGYWVWLIPLASNSHSIGIVADPRFHPFERISTFEAALDWLHEFEPQLAKAMEERKDDIQDFLKIEKFSHGCERVFSPQRWAMVGEAGVFIDPLYSPGSDYIAMANTYVGDLIKRDLGGEDITARAEGYNRGFLFLFDLALTHVWTNHYQYFGDAEVFAAKVTYDYVVYWGVNAPRMYYDKLTDLEFTQATLAQVQRSAQLAVRVQQLFRDWHAAGQPPNPTGIHAVTSKFPGMWDRLKELKAGLDDETLLSRYTTNVDILEGMAVMLFHKAAKRLPDGPPDPERKINPHAISLHPERWEADGLFDDNGLTLAEARQQSQGFEVMLLDELAVTA